MKENKGKNVASGTKVEEDVQVQDEAALLAVQKPVVQARKRKNISIILTLVIFQDVEVLSKKSLIRPFLPRFQSFQP